MWPKLAALGAGLLAIVTVVIAWFRGRAAKAEARAARAEGKAAVERQVEIADQAKRLDEAWRDKAASFGQRQEALESTVTEDSKALQRAHDDAVASLPSDPHLADRVDGMLARPATGSAASRAGVAHHDQRAVPGGPGTPAKPPASGKGD